MAVTDLIRTFATGSHLSEETRLHNKLMLTLKQPIRCPVCYEETTSKEYYFFSNETGACTWCDGTKEIDLEVSQQPRPSTSITVPKTYTPVSMELK